MEECTYKTKTNKMENLINDDLDSSLSDIESDMNLIIMNLMINLLKIKTVF